MLIVTGDVDGVIYHHRVANTHAMKQRLQVEKSRRSKEEVKQDSVMHLLKGDRQF